MLNPSIAQTAKSHSVVSHPREWEAQGVALAALGSESTDQCIELANQNCENFYLRVETLQNWGISNAAIQIRNFSIFSELEPDDPLRKLSNSQRNALLQAPEQFHDEVMQRARALLKDGRPAARITDEWTRGQVGLIKAELQTLTKANKTRTGQTSPSTRLAIQEQLVQKLEADNQRLTQENVELLQLIDAMNNDVQEAA